MFLTDSSSRNVGSKLERRHVLAVMRVRKVCSPLEEESDKTELRHSKRDGRGKSYSKRYLRGRICEIGGSSSCADRKRD